MNPSSYDTTKSGESAVIPDPETAPADYWRARFYEQGEQLRFILNGPPIEGTEGYEQNIARYNTLFARRSEIFIGTLGSAAIAAYYES